jgi:hypothetical protein
LRAASDAKPFYAGGASSPNVSMTVSWRRGRGERPGSTTSSITLDLLWAPAGGEFRPKTHAPGEQRHFASGRSKARLFAFYSAKRDRHR